MMEVCYSNTEEHQCWKCVITYRASKSSAYIDSDNGTQVVSTLYCKRYLSVKTHISPIEFIDPWRLVLNSKTIQ